MAQLWGKKRAKVKATGSEERTGHASLLTKTELDEYARKAVDLTPPDGVRAATRKKETASLTVFKDAAGAYRWVLQSSNAYRDRDREIVSTKALSDDLERSEKEGAGDYGPLRWWHVEGAELGTCDFRMLSDSGRTLIESGTFKSREIAEAVKEAAPRLQVSIGFHHPADQPDRDGVFHAIRVFERSLLPAGKAANPFTKVAVKGDEPMATKAEKLAALKALGIDPNEILQQAEATEKELDDKGVAFKEGEDAEAPAAEAEEKEAEAEAPAVEAEAETDKAKKPAPKADEEEEEGEDEEEAEDDEEEEEYMEADVIGNMSRDEFKAFLKECMAPAPADKKKEADEAAERAALKEAQDAQAKALEAAQAEIKKLRRQVKELAGETPRAVKGYVASEADDTVEDDAEKLKELGAPEGDAFAAQFINTLLTGK